MKPVLANLKAVHVLRTVPGQLVHASASPLHAWQTTRSPSRCTRRADVAARAFPFLSKLFGVKEEVKEGPQLVRIDYEAEGGVGGTSDALFGPLVCSCSVYPGRLLVLFVPLCETMLPT